MLKEVALLSPIFITFFWSLVFFIQFGRKDKVKYHLGFFMVFAFLLYCSHAIFFSKQYYLYSLIEGVYIFSMLSLYPIYYGYLLLVSGKKRDLKKELFRFAPALIFCILIFVLTLVLNKDEQIKYVKEILMDKNLKDLNITSLIGIKGIVFFLSRMVFLIHAVFFGIKGVQLANNHNQFVKEYYSNTEGKTLNWIRRISVVIIVASIASIIFTFIGRSYFSHHEVSLLIPSVVFSFFLFIIGFKGNQQVSLKIDFEEEGFVIDTNDVKNNQKGKLKDQLIKLFEEDKIYKNPDLRITSFTGKLKTNRTYISKMINEEFSMNFNEFVNTYRIEEAKNLLKDASRNSYTLEYIAEKSGFGSVSSFTRIFKLFKKQTPGEYRNKLNNR